MPITPANLVIPQTVNWLIPYIIPSGKLVLLDGDPDLGKSLIALDLCARLSTGRTLLGGQSAVGPANALVLNSEDKAADTIIPRLQHLGADMARVFVWQRERDDEEWPWQLPRQIARLDEALTQTDARLAFIDPINSFMDEKVNCANDQSVRRALAPLIRLADKHSCALVMNRNLNKQGGTKAIYRGIGSIAFTTTCRVTLLVGYDPEVPGRRVLAQGRNTITGVQPSLAYGVTGTVGSQPMVEWLGTSPFSADDLLAGETHRKGAQRDQAAAFLEQFLADGPRTAQDVWEAAQKRGLSERTIRRAKNGLGIRSRRLYTSKHQYRSYWLLRNQELPAAPSDTAELDQMLAELERQYPSATPLDDDDEDGGYQ